MPECAKSGYGVLTDDKKVIKFDAASNAKAKQFIADLKKEKDIKVNVTGTINGETYGRKQDRIAVSTAFIKSISIGSREMIAAFFLSDFFSV